MTAWRDSSSIFPNWGGYPDPDFEEGMSEVEASLFRAAADALFCIYIIYKDRGISTIKQGFEWWNLNRPETVETRRLNRVGYQKMLRVHWLLSAGGWRAVAEAFKEGNL